MSRGVASPEPPLIQPGPMTIPLCVTARSLASSRTSATPAATEGTATTSTRRLVTAWVNSLSNETLSKNHSQPAGRSASSRQVDSCDWPIIHARPAPAATSDSRASPTLSDASPGAVMASAASPSVEDKAASQPRSTLTESTNEPQPTDEFLRSHETPLAGRTVASKVSIRD